MAQISVGPNSFRIYPMTCELRSKCFWLFWIVLLTLSWRKFLSYRSQTIDLFFKSMAWFLYDRGLHHDRVSYDSDQRLLWTSVWEILNKFLLHGLILRLLIVLLLARYLVNRVPSDGKLHLICDKEKLYPNM